MSLKFSQFALVASPSGAIELVGYVGGSNVRATLASFPVSTATQTALNLKAPLNETPRVITDASPSPSTVSPTDLIIDYQRTDSDDLVFPDPAGIPPGKSIIIANNSAGNFLLNCETPGSFFNGGAGEVNGVDVQTRQTVLIRIVDGKWRVVATGIPPSAIWGDITGNIEDQSDLVAALAAAGGVLVSTQDFRLTTESGVPVSTGDRTAQSTLYFTPSDGNQIALYNGATWDLISSAEVSLALSGLTDATNYDVFAFNDSGVLTLELSAAWSGPNTPTDAIVLQDGVSVKSSDHTRRLIGMFRTTSTTTTEDSALNRFLDNADNKAPRALNIVSGPFHTYGTSTWREWNGGVGDYRVSFVSGSVQWFRVGGNFEMNGSGPSYGSIALNSTTVEGEAGVSTELGSYLRMACGCVYQNLVGFNQLVPLEMSFGSGNYASFRINAMLLN